jgi:hypothetical protein
MGRQNEFYWSVDILVCFRVIWHHFSLEKFGGFKSKLITHIV